MIFFEFLKCKFLCWYFSIKFARQKAINQNLMNEKKELLKKLIKNKDENL